MGSGGTLSSSASTSGGGGSAGAIDLEIEEGALSLWYDAPAGVWNEALPVGNGRLGAMVFGGPASEKLQLNVLRMKKKLTVDVTIPEDTRGSWERRLDSDEDVLMPAPPVAAAAPAMAIGPVSVVRPLPAAGRGEVHIITDDEPL